MDAGCSDSATKTETSEKEKSTPLESSEESTLKRGNSVQFNFLDYVEVNERREQQENHQSRLQKLRKELNYIKETDWQYDSIEKHIGQS